MKEFRLQPRFADMGERHVRSTAIPVWCEEARVSLYEEVSRRAGETAVFGVVRRAEYDYRRELYYRAEALIRTAVQAIGTSSATVVQEIWQNDQLAVRALVVLVQVNRVTGEKLPLSTASRIYLEELMSADGTG
jgi:acyl-CoA thioester hydrolase